MSSSSSSKPMEFVMGTHIFEISSYTVTKSMVEWDNCLRSSTFIVGGREWVIEFYPNGRKDAPNSISAGIRLVDKMEEVRASFSLMLFDWSTSKWTHKRTSDLRTFDSVHCRWTWTFNSFIQFLFEISNCLSNDMLKIKCVLCVVVPSEPENFPKGAQPKGISSDTIKHYTQRFQSGLAADVKFLVQGKTFPAHRWVLAAYSPVFKETFFNTPIAKGEKIQEIIIADMNADTFNSLLYFIYTDSMPTEEEDNSTKESMLMTQRLLAAADRYKMDKLKSICIDKLSKGLISDTVATTLVLAEEHNCSELREACIEFLLKNKSYTSRRSTGWLR